MKLSKKQIQIIEKLKEIKTKIAKAKTYKKNAK